MGRLAVIAIGGNSITKAGQRGTIAEQFENTRETARHIARLIARGLDVVVTHGNGPQVGNILLRAEMASSVLPHLPLATCGADSQGGMGYMIQQMLGNELRAARNQRCVVSVVTQTVVNADDPAFSSPSKPIGPFYTADVADRKAHEHGWKIVEDAHRGWRRVVPSPMPQRIVEADAIAALLRSGCIVIGAGGGGIPVVEEDGELRGVEAVIDKDHASRLLANQIGASLFMMSTDVERVSLFYGTDKQEDLSAITIEEAKRYQAEGHFPPGSMGPKVQASVAFIEGGGEEVIITNPQSIEKALDGKTGTRITR